MDRLVRDGFLWATDFVVEQAVDEHSLPVFVEVIGDLNWREVRHRQLYPLASLVIIDLASLCSHLPPLIGAAALSHSIAALLVPCSIVKHQIVESLAP